MKLYLSKTDTRTPSVGVEGQPFTFIDVWEATRAAKMDTDNEETRTSRAADRSVTLSFNGYGGDEVHSARRPNTNDPYTRREHYAATWDQWGVLLSILFALDPDMRVGSNKRPYYDGAEDFHHQTDGRFRDVTSLDDLDDYHGDHRFEFANVGAQKCTKCPAMKRRRF